MNDPCLFNYESMSLTCRTSICLYDYEMSIHALPLENHSFMLC
jgi:hypothetical protein